MKTLAKVLSILLALSLVLCAFAACAKSGQDGTTTPDASTDAPTGENTDASKTDASKDAFTVGI